MCYPFELLQPKRADGRRAGRDLRPPARKAAPDAWPCWAYSNHDTVRHITRWGLGDAAARAYATLLICLRGSVCLYQGEELGLPEAELAFEDLQDPYGIEFWPEFKGRDGCRTPMVWAVRQPRRAASPAPRSAWLPVPAAHLGLCGGASGPDDGASMLAHYRRALALPPGPSRAAHRGDDGAGGRGRCGDVSPRRRGRNAVLRLQPWRQARQTIDAARRELAHNRNGSGERCGVGDSDDARCRGRSASRDRA